MSNPQVSSIPKYVDTNGRLTVEGFKLFQAMLENQRALEERIAALEP